MPGVEEVRITAKRDQLLEPLPEGDSYWVSFSRARENAAEAVSALRAAHARLTFRIELKIRDFATPIRLT